MDNENYIQKNEVVVVIPIYKKSLSSTEEKSLKQCIKILKDYKISFVSPNNLDTINYENICNSFNKEYNIFKYDNNNFSSLINYSKFMLKPDLYMDLSNYKYMLIYQLDAWVFRDELQDWCNKGYDYIGAPWFESFNLANEHSKIMEYGGNGGFSLRKIESMIKLLTSNYKLNFNEFLQERKKKRLISNILNIPSYLIKYSSFLTKNYFEITDYYEDYAIVKHAKYVIKDFKIPKYEEAMQFSFEAQPKRLYKMNNNLLPFGCHAFEKYDLDFWKQFINV